MKTLNLLFLLSPLSRAVWDAIVIEEKNNSINYLLHNSVTIATILLQAIALHSFLGYGWVITFAVCFSTHWLMFDFVLNWFRDKPVLTYYGDLTDEQNLSFIERHVYRRLSWQVLLILKFAMFTTTIIILNNLI